MLLIPKHNLKKMRVCLSGSGFRISIEFLLFHPVLLFFDNNKRLQKQ